MNRHQFAQQTQVPRLVFPLVHEMAAAVLPGMRVPVAVTVAERVLGFSEQAYYQWVVTPKSRHLIEEVDLIGILKELHGDDPQLNYRFLADELHAPAKECVRGNRLAPPFRGERTLRDQVPCPPRNRTTARPWEQKMTCLRSCAYWRRW